MNTIKNPARSRPLSANVKRLMKMARESPQNPAVEKIERDFSTRDLAYCDMQGNCMVFPFDIETREELKNAAFTVNGFYLDLAYSRYLDINVQRSVLIESSAGVTEDIRFNRPARDGEK